MLHVQHGMNYYSTWSMRIYWIENAWKLPKEYCLSYCSLIFFKSKKKIYNKLLAAIIYISFLIYSDKRPIAATKYYIKSDTHVINWIIFTSLCQFD